MRSVAHKIEKMPNYVNLLIFELFKYCCVCMVMIYYFDTK